MQLRCARKDFGNAEFVPPYEHAHKSAQTAKVWHSLSPICLSVTLAACATVSSEKHSRRLSTRAHQTHGFSPFDPAWIDPIALPSNGLNYITPTYQRCLRRLGSQCLSNFNSPWPPCTLLPSSGQWTCRGKSQVMIGQFVVSPSNFYVIAQIFNTNLILRDYCVSVMELRYFNMQVENSYEVLPSSVVVHHLNCRTSWNESI